MKKYSFILLSFISFFDVSVFAQTWTLVDGAPVWTVDSIAEQAFPIPDIVPNDASDVLVYIVSGVGNSNSPENHVDWQIWTFNPKSNGKYLTLLHLVFYNNPAWVTNSDNVWLPLTSERLIHSYLPVRGNGSYQQIRVIGYR